MLVAALALAAFSLVPSAARAQLFSLGPPAASPDEPPPSMQKKPPSIDDSIEAGESEEPNPPEDQKLMHWSDYKGEDFTFHFGYNAMYDINGYNQDRDSVDQFGVLKNPDSKWRDFRLLAKGTFPKMNRLVEWKAGYMYDGLNEKWLWRETGVIVGVPEIWGHLFIGRTKLGISMIRHMSGASIMGLERSPMDDATIPIQNDGIRWMGYLPKQHLVWNLGYFNETILHQPLAPFYDQQYASRIAWLPLLSEKGGQVLHLAVNLRYGNPKDGKIQLKDRPESSTAPYFIDTGVFPAQHTWLMGPEVYYRKDSLLLGGSYSFQRTYASQGDHTFQGGDFWVSYLLTGETRTYITRGALFDFVYPKSSFFKGGTGALEATIHTSFTNMDSGTVQGGKLWRVTPMLAWYPSYEFRVTIGYGYGVLDRFGKRGATQFYLSRIQFML